jgi:catalase
VIVGPDSDPAEIETVQTALHAADVLPLVIGPHGGKIGGVTIQRTYSNASSVEFDAFVVVGDTPPADDALPSLDAKSAAEGGPDTATDPRVLKLLGEAWRHSKAIGGLVESPVLAGAGIPLDAPGVVVGDGDEVAAQLLVLLAAHRAWERFPTTMSV